MDTDMLIKGGIVVMIVITLAWAFGLAYMWRKGRL